MPKVGYIQESGIRRQKSVSFPSPSGRDLRKGEASQFLTIAKKAIQTNN